MLEHGRMGGHANMELSNNFKSTSCNASYAVDGAECDSEGGFLELVYCQEYRGYKSKSSPSLVMVCTVLLSRRTSWF